MALSSLRHELSTLCKEYTRVVNFLKKFTKPDFYIGDLNLIPYIMHFFLFTVECLRKELLNWDLEKKHKNKYDDFDDNNAQGLSASFSFLCKKTNKGHKIEGANYGGCSFFKNDDSPSAAAAADPVIF